MTKEELIAKIRAEIEKQIKDPQEHCYGVSSINKLRELLDFINGLESEKTIFPWKKIHTYTEEIHEGDMEKMLLELSVGKGEKRTNIALPDRIVDTLESEKPMQDGLEEEIDKYREEHLFDMPAFQQVARHFYELGCCRTAEKYDEIEYNRQREEEKSMNPERLEEELERFIESGKSVTVDDYGTYKVSYHDFKKVARHFAEWQKEQDDRLVDIIYQQGIEKGKDEIKEKAIEGHLFRYPPFTNPLISVSGINPDAFTNGDTRVKLIIIKEEER